MRKISFLIFVILSTFLASFSKKANFKRRFRNHGKILSQIFRSSTECSGHGIVILLIFGGSFFMEKYQKINILRIDTEVSEIELRKNWFFQKFKCKISFYNIWEPKMSQLIVIGSHWGFAGCSLVSQWGSLRVIWWSFGGHSGFF